MYTRKKRKGLSKLHRSKDDNKYKILIRHLFFLQGSFAFFGIDW